METLNRHFAWEFTCGACFACNSENDLNSLLLCEGGCRRSFHLRCVGLTNFPTGQQTWSCRWCVQRLRFCWLCQTYGSSLERCSHPSCAKTFHPECLRARGFLEKSSICPFHGCHNAGNSKCPKTDMDEDCFFCTKCPRSFHPKCLPSTAIALGDNFCICDFHTWKGSSLEEISRSPEAGSGYCSTAATEPEEESWRAIIARMDKTPYSVPSWLRDPPVRRETESEETDKSGMKYEKIKNNQWLCPKPPKVEESDEICGCKVSVVLVE